MSLDPQGDLPPLPASGEKIVFSAYAGRRVRGVWKLDALREDRLGLDPRRREGGWGAVAVAMRAVAGGTWTARALSTLIGVANALGRSR